MFGRDRKRRRRLEAAFGKKPDVYYTDGDMERIRAWSDYRRTREDGYSVDDVTWHDLDMDRVFRRIDPGLSTPGEQVLYDTLRHPALTGEEYGRRARLIALMEGEPTKRLEIQVILDALGRTRRSDLCTAFVPEERGRGRLALYAALAAAFAVSLVLGALGVMPFMAVLLLMSLNITLREFALRRVRREFDTLNYSVAEVFALRRVQKLGIPDLDRELTGAYEALKKLRFVLRTGGVSGMDTGNAGDLLASVFLLDIITYEYLKNKLWTHQEDLMAVIEGLGRLDTAIAAASWRESMDVYAVPDIAFDGAAELHVRGMVHPLLDAAVPNDLDLGGSILLTGSNASGKSTYLRTALLNALLAGKWRMCHFAETVGEGSMDFDYRLREGPARSRNAVRLLGMMGFDGALVSRAERRAKRYLETGAWE